MTDRVLREDELAALRFLADPCNPGGSFARYIARVAGWSPTTTASSKLKALERLGYVPSGPVPKVRLKVWRITEKGREALKEAAGRG